METPVTWCPSGRPDRPESQVLGVRSGEDGKVVYLERPMPAAEVLGAVPEGIEPTRVLRFASHCVSACVHRRGNDCTLVERVGVLPAAGEARSVPRCHLRSRCQWWQQTGVSACHRCPAVATAVLQEDTLTTLVADPATTLEQLDEWIAQSPDGPSPGGAGSGGAG
ncbi:hypothetical protein GTW66_03885 [Streptomyces sp. SID5473]|uniref:Nitrogen fixation protein n=1 Tax=Streptomyces tsukubensis (strain DSM 42081 / NBRC 108919 / NRRL 18488 / 9993) TaxID=1114943 RepID=A0A7G3URT5_STRT9|nr:hypothetical protein [Streptomyces sp. SID5473]QKM72021.1 hypothetical protein STSU_031000 [Streptomyces tsukubensis NRRL18488]TAI41129.1 hypothetical protein EWI31_28845 [Streptomyces tsukubensis]